MVIVGGWVFCLVGDWEGFLEFVYLFRDLGIRVVGIGVGRKSEECFGMYGM